MNNRKFHLSVAVAFVVLGLSGMMYSASSSNYFSSVVSSNPDELLDLRIDPKSVEVQVGDSAEFTSYGEYSTTTSAVKSEWYLDDDTLGELSCAGESSKRCTFTAGESVGATTLRIENENFEDSALISVIEPLTNDFTDELPDWSSQATLSLSEAGIIQGYEDGRYGSEDPLTRSQIVTLLHRLLAYAELEDASVTEGKDCNVFSDVDSAHFAYTPICYFHYAGWVDVTSGAFGADDQASRGLTSFYTNNAFGDLLQEILELDDEDFEDVSFSDVPTSHQFYDAIVAMNTMGIMTGYDDGTFGPDISLNRAEAAVVLYRVQLLLDLIEEE